MQAALLVEDGRYPRGEFPGWLTTAGSEAGQLWAALAGVDPNPLRRFFKRGRLFGMDSDLERYCRGYRENALICYRESEEGRVQGRNGRPMRREQKRLAKTNRK